MLPSLQSGFAVTLSLRGAHEGRLGSSQNGLGACQWAACQHTVRPGTFDAPHEDERTDGRKAWQGDFFLKRRYAQVKITHVPGEGNCGCNHYKVYYSLYNQDFHL